MRRLLTVRRYIHRLSGTWTHTVLNCLYLPVHTPCILSSVNTGNTGAKQLHLYIYQVSQPLAPVLRLGLTAAAAASVVLAA